MITMIILLWIASALNAPVWVYILGGLYLLFKPVMALFQMCWEEYRWQDK